LFTFVHQSQCQYISKSVLLYLDLNFLQELINEDPPSTTIEENTVRDGDQSLIELPSSSNTAEPHRPRSLPQTPITSPRLRRPDTLNVVCVCCLSVANSHEKPQLAQILKVSRFLIFNISALSFRIREANAVSARN
jgi:hypothetical protein